MGTAIGHIPNNSIMHLSGNNTGTVVSQSAGIYECLIVPPLDSNEEKFPKHMHTCLDTKHNNTLAFMTIPLSLLLHKIWILKQIHLFYHLQPCLHRMARKSWTCE